MMEVWLGAGGGQVNLSAPAICTKQKEESQKASSDEKAKK